MRHVLNFNSRAGFWYVTFSLYRSNCFLPKYTFKNFVPPVFTSFILPPTSSMHWPVPWILLSSLFHMQVIRWEQTGQNLCPSETHIPRAILLSPFPLPLRSSFRVGHPLWWLVTSPRAWMDAPQFARCWFQRCCHLKFCLHADSPPSDFKTKSPKIVFCH